MLDHGAYGQLCAMWPAVLEPIQERIVDASRTAAESLDRAGLALRSAAAGYVASDTEGAHRMGSIYGGDG
jgi:ribulose 1,5-bisphosphate synthetase/thiazole synthase